MMLLGVRTSADFIECSSAKLKTLVCVLGGGGGNTTQTHRESE
jgi:hypothetical protein